MVQSLTLDSLMSPSELRELADPRSYMRGTAYFGEGRVELIEESDRRVVATVRGTFPYRVVLRADDGGIDWSCSCPVGDEGAFCKHCVAVALTVHDAGVSPRPAPARSTGGEVDLAAYVEGLERAELVELVLSQVDRDWRFAEQLVARAAAEAGSGIDERAWRRRLDAVFEPTYDDFVPWQEASGWAAGVDEMLDALEGLIDAGHPDAVVGLAEYAHGLADAAIQFVDDSGGQLAVISERLSEIHLRACEQGSPDPVELARRLAALELTSELGAFHRAAATYADVLGTAGLDAYRAVVEPAWQALDPDADSLSSGRFHLTEALVGVALGADDPDELIRVRQRNLRVPDDYGEIAAALQAAGRTDEAIDWARRGLDAFAASRPWQTTQLRELLADMLHARGDTAAALDLFWTDFDQHPSVDAYRRLVAEAELTDCAGEWRDRAITALRDRVAQERTDGADHAVDVGALVEVLMHEGDADGAWDVATAYGCNDRLWLALAIARQDEHPLDAIPIFEREAAALIDTTKRRGYEGAVKLLARVRTAAATAGQPELFDRIITDVRTTHRRKRSLMAMLDAKGW